MSRARLPKIDFTTLGGLVTKVNPLLVGSNGLVTCQNMDTFAEYGSLSKVPGSTRVSDSAGASWHSIHFYEHYNLAGVLQRQVVGLAGTELKKINSDKSLTTIQTGLIAETLTGVVSQDRLHLTSPSNDPMKVDSGNVVTRWGVTPPGGERLVIDSFSDSTTWTPTDCTLADADGIDSQDGSMAFVKTSTSVTQISANKTTGLSTEATARYNFISVFIPEGVMDSLTDLILAPGDTSGDTAIVIEAEIAGGLSIIWYIPKSDLEEGRNLISLDALEGFIGGAIPGSVLAGPVTELTITINTAFASATFSDLRVDDFYSTDQGFLEGTLSATAGTIHGEVSYRVTYVSKFGQESNAGPASAAVDTGATDVNAVDLTLIPISHESQVVARRIYRDQDGDAIWRFVTEIGDNATTTFTDTDGFHSLSDETTPLAGNSENDYSRPRRMTQVIAWGGFLIGMDAVVKSQVNLTYKNRPEAWPIARRVAVDYTVTALIPTTLGVEINGKDRCVLMRGTDWTNLIFEEIAPEHSVGCSGWRAWAPFKGLCAKWHDVGPYADLVLDPWYLGNPIKDQIEALDGALFEDLIAVHDRRNFRMLFLTGEAHRSIFSWGYGRTVEGVVSAEGSGIDPLDFRRGAWRTLSLATGVNPTCFAIVERPGDKPEAWMGCTDGFVYWIGDPGASSWSAGLDTEAIVADAEWEWMRHPQGADLIGRFVDLAIKSTASSTWTWTASSAEDIEGSATMTATGTVSVNGVHESVTPIPAGVQGPYLKLRLQNSGLDEDGMIRRAAIHVVPRREQREE